MKVLVTGGAGFIGRWLVKKLLTERYDVWVLDNLSNGFKENLEEFKEYGNFKGLTVGEIQDINIIDSIFSNKFDICFHLAANIVVQNSIDNPRKCFESDMIGTFNVLEGCKKYDTRLIFMSTCMVYSKANNNESITEDHPLKPASPYAGIKISCENMVMSYFYTYNLPVTIVRPFNTYGPFQRSDGEGGVISVFLERAIKGLDLNIYGDGTQTRDFIYVEDCAEFVVKAGLSDKTVGEIINAGSGKDITINELARLIMEDSNRIKHVPHIHPQSEIQKLLASSVKAERLLNWKPRFSLEEGIARTREWLIHKLEG